MCGGWGGRGRHDDRSGRTHVAAWPPPRQTSDSDSIRNDSVSPPPAVVQMKSGVPGVPVGMSRSIMSADADVATTTAAAAPPAFQIFIFHFPFPGHRGRRSRLPRFPISQFPFSQAKPTPAPNTEWVNRVWHVPGTGQVKSESRCHSLKTGRKGPINQVRAGSRVSRTPSREAIERPRRPSSGRAPHHSRRRPPHR